MKPKQKPFFTALLYLLFFSACDLNTFPDNTVIIEPPVNPFPLSVKGKVSNTQTENLPNICITIPYIQFHIPTGSPGSTDSTFYTEIIKDTVYTAIDGTFEWQNKVYYSDTIQVILQLTDPDGYYTSGSLHLLFTTEDWKSGNLQKEIDIQLQKKTE